MKTIAYTALRYGADYLPYAIQSVLDAVDEYHVLYAMRPSHGHWSDAPLPPGESENDLHALAWQAAGTKLRWHRGEWVYEGQQRDSIISLVPDADVIISVDSDEIYSEALIWNILDYAEQTEATPRSRYLRVPFVHYWRSFYRCVLHDPAYPARVTFPKVAAGEDSWESRLGVVNHMGYAIRPALMAYKWQIHGHKDELRRDCDWFNDVYMANRQVDCHPVGSEWWTPETVEPLDFMPYFMTWHPFFNLDVIT